jgi:hypothetical protein
MTEPLLEFVTIRGRFHRSVNVAGDWQSPDSLAEYLPTTTVQHLTSFVLDEARRSKGTRCWSITGPYGSGKSALALFLADCMARKKPSHPIASALKRRHARGMALFMPVFLSAERGPLAPLLSEALDRITRDRKGSRRGAKASERNGELPAGTRLVDQLAAAATSVKRRGLGGILIVIDELGKFLEFAAQRPRDGDVYLLQQLAEAATRSAVPVVFVTILHSGFSDYLPVADEHRRSEWQKVQGRFRDVPFQLPPEQILELIGAAINARPPVQVERGWRRELEEIKGSGLLDAIGFSKSAARLLRGCMPLHPVTALLLWPLFRSKGAQNERSLFAFLSSHEPFGFREFLGLAQVNASGSDLFRLPRLHDYVTAVLGVGVFRGDQARRWSLIDNALARLPADAPPLVAEVVKSIGLLSLYGAQVGLRPSVECLVAALGDGPGVQEACDYLLRSSRVVYRRHLDALALWEGSDFDVEGARAQAALKLQGANSDVPSRLSAAFEPRPVVARAHYIRSGTFRHFEVQYVDGTAVGIERAMQAGSRSSADGKLLFALPSGSGMPDLEVVLKLSAVPGNERVLVAIPYDLGEIRRELEEYEAWRLVQAFSPELSGDHIARQEVAARVSDSFDRLTAIVGPVLGLPGHSFDPSRCVWVHRGNGHVHRSAVGFQRWISGICDSLFPAAPPLRNELLNRDALSSAASAARRNLIALMLSRAGEERLGIEGTPPEASMFESMLRAGGFYRSVNGRWRFDTPTKEWQPAWRSIEAFLETTNANRRPVTELVGALKAPPTGLRDGPIPVLLCAFLLTKQDEVALYEDGVFVPDLRIEVFERILRRPETFEIRRQVLSPEQARTLRSLRSVLTERMPVLLANEPAGASTVGLARVLVLFAASLPPYARQTRRLENAQASRVRDQLLGATDPSSLLFRDLPVACGVDRVDEDGIPVLVERLAESLRDLSRAYPSLLDEIEMQLRTVFALSSASTVAWKQLQQRAEQLTDFVSEPKLKTFVYEASHLTADRDWRAALGRAVNAGLPPSHWRDADAAAFQLRLSEVYSDFVRIEELSSELRRTGAPQVIRFGLLESSRPESRAVIPIRGDIEPDVQALVELLESALHTGAGGGSDRQRSQLEALGRVAARLLAQREGVEVEQ